MFLSYDSDLQIEIDTAHFKGNFPASCAIEGKIDIFYPARRGHNSKRFKKIYLQ